MGVVQQKIAEKQNSLSLLSLSNKKKRKRNNENENPWLVKQWKFVTTQTKDEQ